MKKINNAFVRVAFIVVVMIMSLSTLSLVLDGNRLRTEKEALQSQITEVSENIERLQNTLNTPFDYEYIVRVAREKLNYRLPEEIVFYNDLNH